MVESEQNYLFILIAASAVGKSELINKMKNENLWSTVSKYSTRDYRGINDDIVLIKSKDVEKAEAILIENKNIEETETNKIMQNIRNARMEHIQEICGDKKGFVYYKNNNIYGISVNEIENELSNSHLAIIISDFHIIKKLKEVNSLKNRIKVLYIASTIDERELLKRYKQREITNFDQQSQETMRTIKGIHNMCNILLSASRLKYMTKIEEVLPLLNEQWNNYLPYFDTIKTRSMNIRMLYNRYIDNITNIDYPILNIYDLEYMFKQVRNIISNISSCKKKPIPPIFMVCAAPSSGKKTLMEIVGDLGTVNKNIVITKKYAKRDKRLTDGRDGMIAIGKNVDFKKYIAVDSDIWSWVFHTGKTEYAVDREEINKNMRNGIAQIFISNMTQIENAKKYFPNNIVILYLHATHETATRTHIEEKRRNEVIESIISTEMKKGNIINKETALSYFKIDRSAQKEFNELIKHDLEEIKLIHYSFLSYNTMIDHVLLNTGTREDLVEQMINLINYYN